jgi:DNA polymerase III alpha subunit
MSADIDIDFADRESILKLILHTPARQMHQGQVRRHNSGVYVTDIPYDPVNQCAAIDYETAEQRGYFKIDFLNMSVYTLIKSSEHYDQMQANDPPWTRLWTDSKWASQLVHVGNYTALLQSMKPDSIPRMAAFISIIRPGKAHLQNKTWDQVFASVWNGDNSQGFVFKKSHAVSYAMLVALHMNLLNQADEPK